MSHNLFAHEEDDENYYGFRKNPQQEAQKLEEEEFEDSRINFELYTWPRILKNMKAGKAVNAYDAYDARMYGSYKQRQEVEGYRKALVFAPTVVSQTEEEKNAEKEKNVAAAAAKNDAGSIDELPAAVKIYVTVSGDTLHTISEQSEVFIVEILRLNKYIAARPGTEIYLNDIIRLPEKSKIGIPEKIAGTAKPDEVFSESVPENTMAPVATGNPDDNFGYALNPDPQYYFTYGIYYNQIVPAIAVITDSRKQAQEFAEKMDYRFYYNVDPVTKKKSILRQKDAAEIFNREHYMFSIELIDEVNSVAQQQQLRDDAVKEGNLGSAFTLLVKKTQEILFAKNYVNTGMYDKTTRSEVKKYIQAKIEKNRLDTDNYAIENLPETIRENATIAQQVAISQIRGTELLFRCASIYKSKNWTEKMRSDYFYKMLKYRDVEPNWSIAEWKVLINQQQYVSNGKKKNISYIPTRKAFDEKNYAADYKKHAEAWHFFKQVWSGNDFVPFADTQLYLLLALEGAKPYSERVSGRFTQYEDFRDALNAYLYNVDDGSTTQQNVTDPNNPSFKGFYENYLYKATDEFLNNRQTDISAQYYRYAGFDDKPKQPLVELMNELAALKPELDKIAELNRVKSNLRTSIDKAGNEHFSRSVKKENDQIAALEGKIIQQYAVIAKNHIILNSREFKTENETSYNFYSVNILITHAHKKDALFFIERFKNIRNERLESIAKLRFLLREDPDKIWLFDQLITATTNELGFINGTAYQTIIAGWQKRVKDKYDHNSILLFVNLISGLISVFFPPAALVLAPVLIGTSGMLLADSIEEYNFNRAASGTGFNNQDSLKEAPSLIWVILNSIALVFDGLTIVQSLKMFRSTGQELSTLIFDKSGRLITDPAELLRIEKQAQQLLISKGMNEVDAALYAKKLTNRDFLLRMEREQAARDTLLNTKKDVPLAPLPPKFQALLENKMLGSMYTAGAYRLQDVIVGDTHLLAVLTKQFADSNPVILARILRTCGEAEVVAPMLGKMHSGFTASGSEFGFGDFVLGHFSSALADHSYLFLRLDAAAITADDVAKAAGASSAGRTTLESFELFRFSLFEKAVANEEILLRTGSAKPAVAAGKTESLQTQLRLEQAIDVMSEQELEQFLKDLSANRRGMDAAEYNALKARGEEKLLSQIEARLLDANGKIDPAKLRVLINELEQQSIKIITGKEGEVILRQYNANALYVPHDTPGMPGTLVFSDTGNRMQVMEELMHLEQHRIEGFRKLSGGEIIDMEIDAHSRMLNYARKHGWTKEEVELLEGNLNSWREDKRLYDSDVKFKEQFDNRKLSFANKDLERDWVVLEQKLNNEFSLNPIDRNQSEAIKLQNKIITNLKNGGEAGIELSNRIISQEFSHISQYNILLRKATQDAQSVRAVNQALSKSKELLDNGINPNLIEFEVERIDFDADVAVKIDSSINIEFDSVYQLKFLDSKINKKKILSASSQLGNVKSHNKIIEIICPFDTPSVLSDPQIIEGIITSRNKYGITKFEFEFSGKNKVNIFTKNIK
ncbi:MAG: hypothetical protein ACK5Z2_01355 [Bacteroidota bacterium]